ncbi:MAG TPA: Mth938-like domain-containing protein [Pseudolabrys sp.]|nr:Mth938-like domain-containing protein [Pseudolabrys sp.]
MVLGSRADAPHSQRPAPIDAYKNRGFRFAGMSHRGSLLCFPDGIWAWSVNDVTELMEATLSAVFDRAESLDFFLIGAGPDPWTLPETIRKRFRELALSVDAMATGAAVRTYNILLAENRPVGARLIAVAESAR